MAEQDSDMETSYDDAYEKLGKLTKKRKAEDTVIPDNHAKKMQKTFF